MKSRLIVILASAAIAAPTFGQSSTSATSSRDQAPPPPQDSVAARQGTAQAYSNNGGSLLRAGRGAAITVGGASAGPTVDPRVADMSFWAVPPPQRRVIRPHSLITIIIKEQSEFKSEGKTSLDKNAELQAQLTQFIKLNLANLSVTNGVSAGGVTPRIDMDASRKFSGDGKVDRKDSFSVRMQAEVVDVKPNGNLVLQARRRLKNDDEERVYLVSGIARVEDVTTDNTILSSQMYDFDLEQTSKGTVREATKRGWLPRLLDAINPF